MAQSDAVMNTLLIDAHNEIVKRLPALPDPPAVAGDPA